MATPRFAWGIDVGNRALKAIRLSPGPEGLRIDDFDVVEHDQVLSNAGDNRDGLIQQALANFVQRHDMRGGVVAVGVSGQSSFARFIKLPPVEPKKIPEIVGFEAKQQIPFPLPLKSSGAISCSRGGARGSRTSRSVSLQCARNWSASTSRCSRTWD